MGKYYAYFIQSIKTNLAYKTDFIMSLLIDVIFFFVSFVLWKTVYSEGNISQIDSYSLTNTITYFFGTSILFRLEVSNSIYMNWMVWTGNFTNDLIKPWRVTLTFIIDAISEKLLVFALYIPIMLFIYFSAKQYLDIPSLSALGLFGITAILAMIMSMAFYFIFHSLSFHWGDQDANIELVGYLAIFFAGAFFPLNFLSGTTEKIFMALPFKYMFYTPIQIFLGKMSTSEIVVAWINMILWTAVFYMIYRVIYKSGLKKYTGTGR